MVVYEIITGRNEVVAKVMSRQGDPPGQGEPPPDQADPTPPGSRLQNMVYERPVCILLECILV